MKKSILLTIFLIFIFNGCFAFHSLNPFLKDEENISKKEIKVPNNAPIWIENRKIKNHITALGATKNVDIQKLDIFKKRTLIVAGNNLIKRVYIKTFNIYKTYLKKLDNPNIFDKDIKKTAEHISLKVLNFAEIKNSWLSEEKELFLQIAVDLNSIAEQIQQSSKSLFKTDKQLYENFLSNKAKKEIIEKLEKE